MDGNFSHRHADATLLFPLETLQDLLLASEEIKEAKKAYETK